MITGFWDGQGLFYPVNSRVHDSKLGKSEDNVLSAAVHDIEEMFLDSPFNVHVEGASVADYTSFVCGLVHVSDCDGGSEFLSRESVFSEKLPVNAGDVDTRVN